MHNEVMKRILSPIVTPVDSIGTMKHTKYANIPSDMTEMGIIHVLRGLLIIGANVIGEACANDGRRPGHCQF